MRKRSRLGLHVRGAILGDLWKSASFSVAFVGGVSMKWLAYVVVAAGSGNLPKSRVEEGPVRGTVCVRTRTYL